MSEALYFTAGIRQLEQAAGACQPPLMQRAGRAVAGLARQLCQDDPILVVAGPGNNGGDALVAARLLRAGWHRVSVVLMAEADRLPADAAAACRAWQADGGELLSEIPADGRWGLVIDGLFGIGLTRPVEGRWRQAIDWINRQPAAVLAIDIPSGLCADTGRVLGTAVRAATTLTFIGHKPGLYTGAGPDHCGRVLLDDLGVAAGDIPADGHFTAPPALAPRMRASHKGSFGSVAVIGGADGMLGAALLAGRAALKLGAGRVYLGLLTEAAPPVDALQPELMLRPPAELVASDSLDALLIGPGLGRSAPAASLLAAGIAGEKTLLLDADALNLLAADARLAAAVASRAGASLLTPHPAEAARLSGSEVAAVQADRIGTARELARRYRATVALKGVGTICASVDGTWQLNRSGNPGLASAGSGDVLAGMLLALLGQGMEPAAALAGAVQLHGAAADAMVAQGVGPVGLTASELIDAARWLINSV